MSIRTLTSPRLGLLLATADAPQSLEASISVEEVEHLPEIATTKKGHPRPSLELVFALTFSNPSIHPELAPRNDAHGFLTLDADLANSRLSKDLQYPAFERQALGMHEPHSTCGVTESQNKKNHKSLGSLTIDANMEDAFSYLELMHDYEIMSMSKGDNDSDKILYPCDEIMADKVIDELVELNTTLNALGWHLEEIHVTWAHLEKKQTRLQLYTKVDEENAYSGCRRRQESL
ncbi:hypothetical protein Tco_1474492 [Tanacetum coccineum]